MDAALRRARDGGAAPVGPAPVGGPAPVAAPVLHQPVHLLRVSAAHVVEDGAKEGLGKLEQ